MPVGRKSFGTLGGLGLGCVVSLAGWLWSCALQVNAITDRTLKINPQIDRIFLTGWILGKVSVVKF